MEDVLFSIKDDGIIVSFLNKKYFKIFQIFYNFISSFNLENLLIICLDKKTFDALKSYHVKRLLCEYEIKERENFWNFRLEKIIEIMEKTKKNIIHTDLDCFWFRNIYEDILQKTDPKLDFVAHMAEKFPQHVAKKLGFVLCCGLFMIRYSKENVEWVRGIMKKYPEIQDDQMLFNQYMIEGISRIFKYPESYNITKIIRMKDSKLVGVINPLLVSRNYYGQSMYGFHPFLRKTDIDGKIREIKNHFR